MVAENPDFFDTSIPRKQCDAGRLAIRYLPLAELKLSPSNPRRHKDEQIQQIAQSIQAFGPIVPVLVDHNGRVLAGHGRVLAARHLGLAEFPSISVEHLTEVQAQAFAIADNRLAENSTWDERLLAEQLKFLSKAELNFDLDVTGFEIAEIDVLVEGLSPADDSSQDEINVGPEETPINVTAPRDLWKLGKNRVFCGDALDPESYRWLMDKQTAAAVFTDPPYNVPIDGHVSGLGKKQHRNFSMASGEMTASEYTDFLVQVFRFQAEHSRPGSLHYLCMDWRHIQELLAACRSIFELKNLCVWVKDNGGMGSLYRSQHELVFVFKYGKEAHRNNVQLGRYGRYRTNVWNYPGANSFSRSTKEGNLLELHPTVKPVALVADAIMDCTARGEIILDSFLGSGTTVIAAETTGRICYGLEIDPPYVDIIIRRWQKFTGLDAVHATSNRSFNELEKEAKGE